jgi:hypothetical protein
VQGEGPIELDEGIKINSRKFLSVCSLLLLFMYFIHSLFNDGPTASHNTVLNGGWFVNNELEMMMKEGVVAYFDVSC